MIDRGRIVLCEPLDQLKAAHRRLSVRFDEPQARPPTLAGSLRFEGFGHEWTAVCQGSIEELQSRVSGMAGRLGLSRSTSPRSTRSLSPELGLACAHRPPRED